MRINILFTGRHYDQAIVPDRLELPDAATVADAISALVTRFPEENPLPSTCLVVVNGQHCGSVAEPAPRELSSGDEVMFIAPVAGG